MIDEKVKRATYQDAKHNMTTDQLETAIAQSERAAATAKATADYQESVLSGLKAVVKERGSR